MYKRILQSGLMFLIVMSGAVNTAHGQVGDDAVVNGAQVVEFRDLALIDAMRIFSHQTGLNIVPSALASTVKVSLYLENVNPKVALDVLCKTHNLWYLEDSQTGIIRIHTVNEYQRDLLSFREEQTEIFTLLYPNAVDVAVTIKDLFGERVKLSMGADDDVMIDELEQRFERFDLLDGRSQGLGSASISRGGGSSRSSSSDDDDRSSRSSRRQQTTAQQEKETDWRQILNAEQIQEFERLISAGQALDQSMLTDMLLRKQTHIYVTVIQRHNRLVVRTSDEKTLKQIGDLIHRLDVPTPMVLLETKVYRVELGDDFESAFDFDYSSGEKYSGGWSLNDAATNTANDFFFTFLSDRFEARLKLLQTEDRLTTLATPLLLTANNEVSQIFVGKRTPITTGFTEPQLVSLGGNNTNVVTIPPAPITEERDVGTLLLLTPNINADRTVNLRLLQETSEIEEDGGTVFVVTNEIGVLGNLSSQIEEREVDIVRRRTLSSTIVAKDGIPVIIGGLIDESVQDDVEKVPFLGDIPILGFFFSGKTVRDTRTELVIVIKPYVLNTPTDAESISRQLVEQLSIHPNLDNIEGTMELYDTEDTEPLHTKHELERIFRLHSLE